MKNLFNAFKLFAIAIAMLGFGNRAIAQTSIQLNDLGTGQINGSAITYNLNATSSVMDNSSTATLTTLIDAGNKTVTLGSSSDLSGYYGKITVADDMTLDFISSVSKTIPAKLFTFPGASFSNTLKLTNTADGLSFTGKEALTDRTITLNDYGILDLTGSTKDITIAGGLYLNGYEANAPVIKYAPSGALATTLPKIIISGTNMLFSSSDEGRIYASKHFSVDLTNATAANLTETAYPLVQLTTNTLDGTPTLSQIDWHPSLLGNGDGSWTNSGLTVSNTGNTKYLNINLTYNPLFRLDAAAFSMGKEYAANWSTMMTNKNGYLGDNALNLQTLRRTQLTGFNGTSVNADVSIDLATFTLGGGSQVFAISAGKSLALKKGEGGNFDGQINFTDPTSRMVWLGTGVTDAILGNNFSGSGSNASGSLQIGDGTTAASATFSLTGTKVTTANKIGTVIVSNNAVLTITQ
ncbi:MAG: hypothetical protein WCP85_31690 [Mariniphaga sp.]